MPPAAFTVGSGFAPDAVEFTIVELALLFWFAIISTVVVALSATSLSLVDIIIIIGRIDDDDDAESTFFFAVTCTTNREDDLLPAAAEATRERASADEVDVKANMVRYY